MNPGSLIKRLLWLSACLAIVLVGISYRYYIRWQAGSAQVQPIPPLLTHSTFVASFSTIGKDWQHFQTTPIAKSLKKIHFIKQTNSLIKRLHQVGLPQDLLDELPLWISLHPLDDNPIEAVFYLGINTLQQNRLIAAMEQQPFHTILHSGQNITVMKPARTKSDDTGWYLLFQKNYVIASLSKKLIQEIAQGLSHKQRTAFLSLPNTHTHKNQSCCIHHLDMAAIARKMVTPDHQEYVKQHLDRLGKFPALSGKTTAHCLLLTGMVEGAIATKTPPWIEAIAPTSPTLIIPATYIPAEAAIVQSYTFQDPVHFSNSLKSQSKKALSIDSADEQADLLLNQLIKNDITHCVIGPQLTDGIVLIQVEDPDKAITTLKEANLITQSPEQELSDSIPIYDLQVKGSNWLPTLAFPGFSGHVLSVLDNYLIIANHVDTFVKVYKSYARGHTWGAAATPPHVFLASTLAAANASFFINVEAAWPVLAPYINPSYKTWMEVHLPDFLASSYLATQVIHIPGHNSPPTYGINLLISQATGAKPISPKAGTAPTLLANTYFQTKAPIVTPPLFVKSHKSNMPYLLIQDADYRLYFVDHTGKLCWEKQIEGPIRTDVYAIDFYNNNRKQYLYSTAESLHLIDYLGNEVPPYPSKLAKHAEGLRLNVVDYDKNKEYRFLLADQSGHIHLKDKQYMGLPSWNPKVLPADFAMTPFHVRIQKKDYFITVHTNGAVYMFNRKGKTEPYFPLIIPIGIHNPAVFKQGNQLATSELTLLSDDGTCYTYNLMGVCLRQVAIPQTPHTQHITLAPDEQGTNQYVLCRQDTTTFCLLNEQGNRLFEKNYASSAKLQCQYHTFGTHHFYAITDPDKQVTFIYTPTGSQLHTAVINNSGQPVRMLFNQAQQQLTVYTSFGNTVQQYQLAVTG